ncbi:GNAT family N-acetyltransferase [Streptomyces sp. NPDC089919]|uniref:GNAT family N-acetyltransferase n=1 Tax=Streptomyces sp. NPDC089919 TaxID=3155188 RepID=UPI00342B25F7
MINLPTRRLPALVRWFPAGPPGSAALTEHVLSTDKGRWWADRAVRPRAIAVECGDHVLLRGEPDALVPADLARFAGCTIEAPEPFRPLIAASFEPVRPWQRIVYVKRSATPPARPPHEVTVRRLTGRDGRALHRLPPAMHWILRTWGGPHPFARSGYAWAAFHQGRIVALACTYFLGSEYEDIACASVPDPRLRPAVLACVHALCFDIAARRRTPSWTVGAGDRSSRLLAWHAGFRPEHEFTRFAVGDPAKRAGAAS